MENSIPVHQNGIETPRTVGTTVTSVTPASTVTPPTSVTPASIVTPASNVTPLTSATPASTVTTPTSVTPVTPVTPLKPCTVSVSPLVIPEEPKLVTTAACSASSSSSSISAETTSSLAPTPEAPMEHLPASQHQVLSTSDITAQMNELEQVLVSSPEVTTVSETPESSTVENLPSCQVQQRESSQSKSSSTNVCEPKELQEGQEIYIQTEGLTVQMAEPGLDRIVIVNGPDGTTMHIQTPEGVPLEAVQALLGIEASDGAKAPQ